MTGSQLRQLLQAKWGYSFDVQLRKAQGKIVLMVMWRYLEQVSFPLSEADYLAHLNAVCGYLNAWGMAEHVEQFISQTKEKPRLGKAINIVLDLSPSQRSEWIVE
jgi:hypothetical protein